MRALPHTYSCFVCGESNPIGLRLRFETDGRMVQTRFVPRPEHIGFKQTVHGGLIATLLDEAMVWACAVQTKRFAFCADLNVRFLNPVKPNIEALATDALAPAAEPVAEAPKPAPPKPAAAPPVKPHPVQVSAVK